MHTIDCLSAISSTGTQKPVVCLEFVKHKYLILKNAAARKGDDLSASRSVCSFRDAMPSWWSSVETRPRANKRRKHEMMERVN